MNCSLTQRPSIRVCDSGMTILELLVAMTLGLIMMAMTVGVTMAGQWAYELDSGRTRVNQNLRSALTILGADIRQAGERLPALFPAVEIIDGDDGAPDEVFLRRHVLEDVLTVCDDIPAGGSSVQVSLTGSGADPAPAWVDGGQEAAYDAWSAYRDDGTVMAYIFDFATQQGEFVDYTAEGDNGISMYVQVESDGLQHSYTAENSAVYIIVEWHYRMRDDEGETDVLEVVETLDEDNAQRVVFGIADFQVRAVLSDDTVQDGFDAADGWGNLKAVEVTLNGEGTTSRQAINSSLTARFFPRNVLSL